MAKKKKIDIQNVFLKEMDGKLVVVGAEGEEVPFENLSEEMRELMQLEKPLDIRMKQHVKRRSPNRKPIFKFQCPGCETTIKGNSDTLNIKCMDCDCEFEILE